MLLTPLTQCVPENSLTAAPIREEWEVSLFVCVCCSHPLPLTPCLLVSQSAGQPCTGKAAIPVQC